MREAIEKIPGELRVCGTAFTALAVIGDGTDGMNHPHLDDHDVISIFVTLGKDIGGSGADIQEITKRSRQAAIGGVSVRSRCVCFFHFAALSSVAAISLTS